MDNNLDSNITKQGKLKQTITEGVKDGLMMCNEKDKKERNKVWLTKRISEIGEDTLLYPKVNAKKHPYTKEVILIASTQGYKQQPISELCGVSQSQVSLWERGENQATIEQLAPLVAKLSPKVPGNVFHYKTIVSKTFIELPDDWEKAMLLKAYSRVKSSDSIQSFLNRKPKLEDLKIIKKSHYLNLSDYNKCAISTSESNYDVYNRSQHLTATCKNKNILSNNFENIERSVLGNLKALHKEKMQNIEDIFNQKIDKKRLLLTALINAENAFQEEIKEYNVALLENKQQRDAYLLENNELNDLTKNKLKEFLNKHFPLPMKQDVRSNQYNVMLSEVINEYKLKNDLSFLDIIEVVRKDISDAENEFTSKRKVLEEEHSKDLLKKTILNKYDKRAEKKVITIKDTAINDSSSINELAHELYSDTSYTLTIPVVREIIGSYGREVEFIASDSEELIVEVSMAKAFVDYCKTLTIITNSEEVQICGESIFNIKSEGLVDADFEGCIEDIKLECYQLFNQDLLLSHSYYFDGKIVNFIYTANDANKLLVEAESCMSRHNWDKSLQATSLDKMKIKLIESGYRLAAIRSIY